jgi:hypothetical protein
MEDTEKAPQPDKVVLYDPMITALMYQCYWCERWATKDRWIPHCICPWCQKKAPTGQEFRYENMMRNFRKAWRYKWEWLQAIYQYHVGKIDQAPCDDALCGQRLVFLTQRCPPHHYFSQKLLGPMK